MGYGPASGIPFCLPIREARNDADSRLCQDRLHFNLNGFHERPNENVYEHYYSAPMEYQSPQPLWSTEYSQYATDAEYWNELWRISRQQQEQQNPEQTQAYTETLAPSSMDYFPDMSNAAHANRLWEMYQGQQRRQVKQMAQHSTTRPSRLRGNEFSAREAYYASQLWIFAQQLFSEMMAEDGKAGSTTTYNKNALHAHSQGISAQVTAGVNADDDGLGESHVTQPGANNNPPSPPLSSSSSEPNIPPQKSPTSSSCSPSSPSSLFSKPCSDSHSQSTTPEPVWVWPRPPREDPEAPLSPSDHAGSDSALVEDRRRDFADENREELRVRRAWSAPAELGPSLTDTV